MCTSYAPVNTYTHRWLTTSPKNGKGMLEGMVTTQLKPTLIPMPSLQRLRAMVISFAIPDGFSCFFVVLVLRLSFPR